MMMRRVCLLLLLCSMMPLVSKAETKETRSTLKHEVRIGYGDPMYETMRWKDEPNKLGVPMNVRQNYRYTGHIYGEYMYRINSWLGADESKIEYDFGDYGTHRTGLLKFHIKVLKMLK